MASRKNQGGAKMGHPVSVQLSPPAYQVRQQAGLGLPNGKQMAVALTGVLVGAMIPAVLISVLPGQQKWIGAFLSGTLGALLAATTPIGTIGADMGTGAFAVAASWMYFDVSGQFVPTSQTGAAQPPLTLPPVGRAA